MSVVGHSNAGPRHSVVRLLGITPVALLLSGLLFVAVVPVAVAASGDWTQFHNGPTHEGYDAAETTLSPSNVADLGVAWTSAVVTPTVVQPAATSIGINSSPAVADGVVYVGLDGLEAFSVGCGSGGATCTPLWTGLTGDYVSSSPAVANGVVYVGSWDGKLYAFAVGCSSGGGACTPLWTGGSTDDGGIVSAPTVVGGVVYVGSTGGTLYAFAVGCGSGGGTCSPLWTATPDGGLLYGSEFLSSPAVANGVVYIGSTDGKLYAYAVGCASGGGTCTPLWTGSVGGGIFESSPAVANGVVYVSSQDGLDAFQVGCNTGGGTCSPLWTGQTGDNGRASPSVADGVVYVGSYDGTLYAFEAGCGSGGGTCTPLWTATTGDTIWSSPAIANGVVYVGSLDNNLYAFAVGCAGAGGSCNPLWTGVTGGYITSSPAVANGVVYVESADGKLYAFGLPTTHFTVSTSSSYAAGSAHTVTVTAKDAFGHTATGYRGTAHFTSTDPAAVLPADYTFTAANAGTHTFSVTLKTAGSQGIRARDTVTSTITGAQYGIVVTPGAAKTLAVSGVASPYVAGVAHSVTVTALDAYGNTATGYRGTIGFTSTDTKALLPANYTFTAADSGVHRFSVAVTLKSAGNESVRARDTVTSTITGGQYPIVVTAAAATTLTVSGLGSPRTHGTAGTITVTAHDAYGNVATGYRGTVTFTSTDSLHAVLPANYTFTAANAGTHTFSVTLKSVGTQAVRARDTVTATITGLESGIVVT
jgi:outer membrane protein assembly factor BamB